MTESQTGYARTPRPQLVAAREALQFIRPIRHVLDGYQSRVAHLSAIAAAGRVKRNEVETQAKLLAAEINNTRHALRTELQNMPATTRQAGPVRDALRGLDSAHQRARQILTPGGIQPPL